jgi:Ca2+-transporting ATPase
VLIDYHQFVGEIAAVLFATLLGLPEPLSPMHLLWVNLVTDGPPATALGYNPADPSAMTKAPRGKNEKLLSTWLLLRYAVVGTYVGGATVGAFIWWYLSKGVSLTQLRNWQQCTKWTDFAHSAEAPHWPLNPCEIFTSARHAAGPQSMALSVLVTIEMLKALSAVSLDSSLFTVPFWRNPYLIPGVALPFLLHLLAMYVPTISGIMGLSPLTQKEWLVVLQFSLPILLVEEVLKAVGRSVSRGKEAALVKDRQSKKLLE